MLEKYAGALPLWMAPNQVTVLPITPEFEEYAASVRDALAAKGIRCELDARNEKIGYRIREAQLSKVPYMAVVGEKEANEGTVAVRSRKEGEGGVLSLADFIARLEQEIATKKK